MAKRLGICGDLEVRKFELEQEYKNTRNWQATEGFINKKDAQDWLAEKSKELKIKIVKDGKPPRRPNQPWYGFIFEHDGPR